MSMPHAIEVILTVALGAAGMTVLISASLKKQKLRLQQEFGRSREALLIGPDIGLHQGGNSFVSLKTYGVIALTDRRVVFRNPLGLGLDLPLSAIVKVSRSEWFRGNRRLGKEFLVLADQEGAENAFVVQDPERWLREIEAAIHAMR